MDRLVFVNYSLDGSEFFASNVGVEKLVTFLNGKCPNKEEDIIIQKLAGGFANDVLRLNLPSGSFVVRIFRGAVGDVINREKEIAVQLLLAENGLAAEILCRFSNGICYRFLEGRPMTLEWFTASFDNSLRTGRKMAALHEVPWRSEMYRSLSRQTTFMWEKMEEFVSFLETKLNHVFDVERVKIAYGTASDVRNRIRELRENLEPYEGHPACGLAVCHNDLLFNNMILDGSQDIMFIDFEYADINYCAFDIANIFNELAGVDPIDEIDYSKYPDYDYQIAWISHYLRYRQFSQSLPEEKIAQLASEFYVIVQKLALASHMFWSLMVLIQSQVIVGSSYDYIAYGSCRLAECNRRKREVLEMNFDSISR